MRAVTVGILLFLMIHAVSAAEPTRLWKAVPGHKNILVDMASIEPMRTVRTLHTTASPDTPRREFEQTEVAIKLNGHLFDHYMLWCSDMNQKGDNTVYFPQAINEPPTKVMGIVPNGVIEAMVCPKARH